MSTIKRFFNDEAGLETVEYAIITGLIVVGLVATVASIGGDPSTALDGFQSGKSTVVAPGTAFSTGAKVPGMNTPDGYAVALNDYYATHSDPVFDPGFVRVIPGQVTRTLTNNCAQHPTGTNCIPPSP